MIYKMHEMDREAEIRIRDARYEEESFLMAVFSANPAAKEVFLKMNPDYEEKEEEGFDFIVPGGEEDIYTLLEQAKRDGVFT